MVSEADLPFLWWQSAQKNRAAKPYVQLPHLSLQELTAEKTAGFMWLLSCVPAPESISFGRGSAIPSLSYPLLTRAGITWTSAHPQLQPHYGAVCRTCSKVTISWGKLKPAGTRSNSARDVLIWSNSPRWGTSFEQAGRGRAGGCCHRLAGDTIAVQTRPRRNADETMWNAGLPGWLLGANA